MRRVDREVKDAAEIVQIMAQYHVEDCPYNHAVADRTRILRLRVQERAAKRRRKMV